MTQLTDSWRDLQKTLAKATESECLQMLNDEMLGAGRLRWLLRIKGRYNVLRDKRESKEIQLRWSERHGSKTSQS